MDAKFIVVTLLFIAGYCGFIKFVWGAMQENGICDVVSRGAWTVWMKDLYHRKSMLEKTLGGCEQCTSWWWVLPFMPVYYFGTTALIGWNLGMAATFVTLMLFWFIASLAGLFTLTHNNNK